MSDYPQESWFRELIKNTNYNNTVKAQTQSSLHNGGCYAIATLPPCRGKDRSACVLLIWCGTFTLATTVHQPVIHTAQAVGVWEYYNWTSMKPITATLKCHHPIRLTQPQQRGQSWEQVEMKPFQVPTDESNDQTCPTHCGNMPSTRQEVWCSLQEVLDPLREVVDQIVNIIGCYHWK